MVLRHGALLASLILINACASRPAIVGGGNHGAGPMTLAETYRRSGEAGGAPATGAFPARARLLPVEDIHGPYMPVVRPGRVIRVWVPAHVADGDHRTLVSGHWAYVMLDDFRWFLEEDVGVTP